MTEFNVDFRLGIVAQGFWLDLFRVKNSKRKGDGTMESMSVSASKPGAN